MNKQTKPLPPAEFKRHYLYEIQMLVGTLDRLENWPFGDKDLTIINAIKESFCVHARNLIEFFEGKKPLGAFAYASSDYPRLVVTGRLETLERQINNEVTHLVFDGRKADPANQLSHEHRLELMTFLTEASQRFGKFCDPDIQSLNLPILGRVEGKFVVLNQ